MASTICKNCQDDLAEIDEDLAAYITEDMQTKYLFNRCPLCHRRSINVEPTTIRRAKFLAISAAIIIAYGAWNSFMYSKALNAPDEINLPDVVERLGSIDKEMK